MSVLEIHTVNQQRQNSNIMKAWGTSTHIDLKNCNRNKISNRDLLESYVVSLCDLMKVQRFGNVIIEKFGDRPEIAGFSLVQLIETSCITGHFVDDDNSAYIDVFSCNSYDTNKVIEFTCEFFESDEYSYCILTRK
jgi:S-adenosylmethionine/arginine decarboxylase-like enzyme